MTYRPRDWFSVVLDVRYKHRHGWLVYQGGRNFGRYHAHEWQPSLDVNWFIAPQHKPDLYLVYNLGNSLLRSGDSDFSELFSDAFRDPIVENFVIKLRYRFGN